MKRFFLAIAVSCLVLNMQVPLAGELEPTNPPAISADNTSQMERELQHLPWKQFRQVIESVPKLKADVDAYGNLGWQFVQGQYTKYPWKKKIDKLDETQRNALASLIHQAKLQSGHPEGQ